MIKIFFDNSIFLHQKNGGISKYIFNLNHKLNDKDINSKIFSPITINDNLKRSKKVIYFVKFNRIPKFCRKLFFMINNFLWKFYLMYYKPNLVHFSYYNNHINNFLNVPYILTVYDLIHERLRLKNYEFSKKKLLIGAKHIICISNFTKKELIRKYRISKNKISVIYLGLNISKKKLIYPKKKIILYVGERGRYKNFINFIYAYSKSSIKNEFKIVCFGGEIISENEKKIFKRYNMQDNVVQEFGDDAKLYKYYQNASLFVTVSLIEGFGLTPLEAMSLGCPVLCSDIQVFREIFGNSCEYVNPKNEHDIKKKIEIILSSKNKQKKLINSGYKLAKKYSWDKCALQTSNLYQKILNE